MNSVTDTAPLAGPAPDADLYSRAEMILLPGLALGCAGDFLLREGPLGIGLFAWLALLAAAALWLARKAGAERLRTIGIWSAAALCAAWITVLRDLEPLIPTMLLVILICAGLTALQTSGVTLRGARIQDYFMTAFNLPLQVLTWTPRLVKQAEFSSVTSNQRVPGITRGILIAAPLLLLFGALFAAADAGFSRYAEDLIDIISPQTLQHLLLVGIFGWLAASLLALACRKSSKADTPSSTPLSIGAVESHVMLLLVSALFGVFVLLQLGYLFGGTDVIVNTSGLTLAEYARRGFFELVIVAALTLALLLALSFTDCPQKILRSYSAVLITCVLIILASAVQRLFMYTDAFGMSLVRFSALAVIVWQVINLVAFALTVLRGNAAGFVSGLVISALGCLLLLGIVNPAGMVTRINLERSIEQNLPLDVAYLLELGADSLPQIIDRFDQLPAAAQCMVAAHLAERYPDSLAGRSVVPDESWRRWNVARVAARTAVLEQLPQLQPAVERARSAC